MCDYEKFVHENGYDDWSRFDRMISSMTDRMPTISNFGFAIPNEVAIEKLARCEGPIVEVGAGLAYWASLVMERYGVRIDCYDKIEMME